jgi:hypothetical protein
LQFGHLIFSPAAGNSGFATGQLYEFIKADCSGADTSVWVKSDLQAGQVNIQLGKNTPIFSSEMFEDSLWGITNYN